MHIILSIFVIIGSFGCGWLFSALLERRKASSGDIVVRKDDGKTIFSLELNDDPAQLEFKKKVIFNVKDSRSRVKHLL